MLFLPTARLLLTRGRGPREVHEVRAAPLPRRLVLLLGIVAFAAFIAEGAAMDWSALYANTVLGADLATSSLAFTTFTVAMTVTRFLGDRLRGRYGPVWTIQRAATTATIGYALVILAPSLPVALLGAYAGWLLVGVGLAMVIPLVFAVAGTGGAAAGRALARVTTFGYVGMLAGPSVIGPLAEETSLRLAMVLPGALAFGIAVVAPVAVRRATGLVRVAPAPAPVK